MLRSSTIYLHHFRHTVSWYREATTALWTYRDIIVFTRKSCHFSRRMNQDTTSLGKIVGLVNPTKADALLKLTSLSYHHISSKARASAAKLIAELRLGICVSLSTAVHTIAAQHTLSTLQVVDEEPLLARWNGEINQDIIIRAIPSSLAIVPYLREILAIHLAIPFLAIDVILISNCSKLIL